ARTKFFDGRVLADELEHLGRFDFDCVAGIAHPVFTPPENLSSSEGQTSSALAQPNFHLRLQLFAKLYAGCNLVSNAGVVASASAGVFEMSESLRNSRQDAGATKSEHSLSPVGASAEVDRALPSELRSLIDKLQKLIIRPNAPMNR